MKKNNKTVDMFVAVGTASVPEQGNYTYILRCADGTFYTGWTNNLKKRLQAHNRGVASRYTKSRLPAELVWFLKASTQSQAMRREAQIKKFTREEKKLLIAGVPLETILEKKTAAT